MEFSRYVEMYHEKSQYDPPFVEVNPLTVSMEFVEKNGSFQTHLMEMLMYENQSDVIVLGIEALGLSDEDGDTDKKVTEGGETESATTTPNVKGLEDSYSQGELGEKLLQHDKDIGLNPKLRFFRLGNNYPVAAEDFMSSYHANEKRDGKSGAKKKSASERLAEEKARIHKSIVSLHTLTKYLYLMCKPFCTLVERDESLSLLGKILGTYDVIENTLRQEAPSQTKLVKNQILNLRCCLTYVQTELMHFMTKTTTKTIEDDSHSYAFSYSLHRAIFSNGDAAVGIGSPDEVVTKEFTALIGQEMWLLFHYLLPSMNSMFKKTVAKHFYEDACLYVDAYSYSYGEVFVRDFYRFEIVTHEMFMKEFCKRKGMDENYVYRTIYEMSKDKIDAVINIVDHFDAIICIPEPDIPTAYLWVFNLTMATLAAGEPLKSGKTVKKQRNTEQEEEAEQLETPFA